MITSEELNKELENEVMEEVKEATPMETMEDYAVELEASCKALNQRRVEITEEESGAGARWAQLAQMMEDRAVARVEIVEVVRGDAVTPLKKVHTFIPASQLSTKYAEKLGDWQDRYMEAVIITADPGKRRLVFSGCEAEKEKKEMQKKECTAQFKAGDVVEGTVNSIKPYDALVRLDDGMDGLFHTPQIGTQRIKHPSAVLTEEQIVKVKILLAQEGKLNLSVKVLAEQQVDKEEHETLDYRGTSSASAGLGNLLKGPKLQVQGKKGQK